MPIAPPRPRHEPPCDARNAEVSHVRAVARVNELPRARRKEGCGNLGVLTQHVEDRREVRGIRSLQKKRREDHARRQHVRRCANALRLILDASPHLRDSRLRSAVRGVVRRWKSVRTRAVDEKERASSLLLEETQRLLRTQHATDEVCAHDRRGCLRILVEKPPVVTRRASVAYPRVGAIHERSCGVSQRGDGLGARDVARDAVRDSARFVVRQLASFRKDLLRGFCGGLRRA